MTVDPEEPIPHIPSEELSADQNSLSTSSRVDSFKPAHLPLETDIFNEAKDQGQLDEDHLVDTRIDDSNDVNGDDNEPAPPAIDDDELDSVEAPQTENTRDFEANPEDAFADIFDSRDNLKRTAEDAGLESEVEKDSQEKNDLEFLDRSDEQLMSDDNQFESEANRTARSNLEALIVNDNMDEDSEEISKEFGGDNNDDDEFSPSTQSKKSSKPPKKKRRFIKEKRSEKNEEDAPPRELTEAELLHQDYQREVFLRAQRIRRSRRTEEEDVRANSEAVQEMTDKMIKAYDGDAIANEKGKPALQKLKLLPDLSLFLQRPHIMRGDFEPGFLHAIRSWLELINAKTLPNLEIRKSLLRALEKMDLDQDLLMASGIGKPIMMLVRHPLETIENKKTAQRLIQRWMAPISMPSGPKPHDDDEEEDRPTPSSSRSVLRAQQSKTLAESDLDIVQSRSPQLSKKAIPFVPPKAKMDFSIIPESNWTSDKDKTSKAKRSQDSVLAKVSQLKRAQHKRH